MKDGLSRSVERADELVKTARILREEARMLRLVLKQERETMRRQRARLREDPRVFARLKAEWDGQREK